MIGLRKKKKKDTRKDIDTKKDFSNKSQDRIRKGEIKKDIVRRKQYCVTSENKSKSKFFLLTSFDPKSLEIIIIIILTIIEDGTEFEFVDALWMILLLYLLPYTNKKLY